jgi:hypothetical protein
MQGKQGRDDVVAVVVQQGRELRELLRGASEAVQEHDGVLDGRVV